MPISSLLVGLDLACMSQHRSEVDLSYDPPLKRFARLEARTPLFWAMARQELKDKIAAGKAAQTARVARMEADRLADRPRPGRADLGPLVRRRRGEIEEEERPDINSDAEYKPTIIGGRRADPLRALLRIRNLHRPHDGADADDARRWVAAQTFRNAVEIAGGARIGDRPMEKVDRSVAMYGPNDMVLDCTRLITTAKAVMGVNYPVVRWVVEEYSGLDEFTVVARVGACEAKEMLFAGLDAAVECFEGRERLAAG